MHTPDRFSIECHVVIHVTLSTTSNTIFISITHPQTLSHSMTHIKSYNRIIMANTKLLNLHTHAHIYIYTQKCALIHRYIW